MNHFFSNKKMIGIVLSLVAIGSLIAISLSVRNNVVSQGVNDITAMLGRLVSYPSASMANFVETIDELTNTYEENKTLKQKIETVYELEVQLNDLKRDNARMKEQLGLQDTLKDYSLVNAAVIGRNPDNWENLVTINKGSNDGLKPNMSVMSGNGLIGKIADVNPTSARVALISNVDSTLIRVAAMIQSETEPVYGTITGYDTKTEQLVMSQIKTSVSVKKGDKVVTSGLGGIAPSSLYIGDVEEITMDRYGLYKEVKIRPAASTNDIRYVTVIVRASESGDE